MADWAINTRTGSGILYVGGWAFDPPHVVDIGLLGIDASLRLAYTPEGGIVFGAPSDPAREEEDLRRAETWCNAFRRAVLGTRSDE